MELVVDKKNITEYTQALEKVAGKQLNLDVLKCILIQASSKSGVTLQATNLDIGIRFTIPADVKKEGVAAVPADVLSSFLGNTSGSELAISKQEEVLSLKVSKTTASINTVPHEDFPTLPTVSGKETKIPGEKLAQGLKSVWYAASPSSMKPELSSVLMNNTGDKIHFVATDSFRLAEKKIHTDETNKTQNILIPLKNTTELIRNLEGVSGEVVLTADSNQLAITFDDTYITSRLIDGTFPDYEQIIPKNQTTEVVVLKQDLIQALKATHVFSNRFNQVTFEVKPKQKSFSIKTTGSEVGESDVQLEASISGEEVVVNFNQKYITDSFQSVQDDSVSLRFFGQGKPMIIRGVSDNSFTYLTMPMNR